MILGDSLSSGYGIPLETSWVSLLNHQLQKHQPNFQIINSSIDGETTLGGLNRIEQELALHNPDIVLIGLGGNDGLQGLSIKSINKNLEKIVETCHQNNASVLLLGMQIPPNYGISYTQQFRDIYPQLAKRFQIKLVPFLLDGFGEKRTFFQLDGIHPNVQAQKKILDNVWTVLYPMLQAEFTVSSDAR